MVAFILSMTLLFELIGALLLSITFIQEFGLIDGIAKAIFHSISAFCNAGFDIMGNYSSLTKYVGNTYINIVIMLLIVFGGLGFYTWEDIKTNKFHVNKYTLQSKIIIITSIQLIIKMRNTYAISIFYKSITFRNLINE